MTVIAIVGPTTLLGKELQQELERRPHLWDRIELIAASEEEEGTVTEAGGAATFVNRAEPDVLAAADLIFACGTIEHDLPLVRRRLDEGEAGATAILLSAGATAEHGEPVISGVNPDAATGGTVLVSPDPVAVLLAYLLAPLARPTAAGGLGATEAAATVVLPVSTLGGQGLDDLFEQTREVLAMTGERRSTVFGRQLAFSLYPTPAGLAGAAGRGGLAALVRRTAGIELPLAVQELQGGVFHGVSVSLFVRFEDDPGENAVRQALAAQQHVAVSDAAPNEVPAPLDAVSREEVVVGAVRRAPEVEGGYWIWAVMDNLTRGGALNAAEVAELLRKIA